MSIVAANMFDASQGGHQHPISNARIGNPFADAIRQYRLYGHDPANNDNDVLSDTEHDETTAEQFNLDPPDPEDEILAKLKNVEQMLSRHEIISAAYAILELDTEKIPPSMADKYFELADRLDQDLHHTHLANSDALRNALYADTVAFRARICVDEDNDLGATPWLSGNKIQDSTDPTADELAHSSSYGSVSAVVNAQELKNERHQKLQHDPFA